MAEDNDGLRDLVAEVAAAYFSNSNVAAADIASVIAQIAASLAAVGAPPAPEAPAPVEEPPSPAALTKLTPAQVRRSITPNALISFEDGKPYKVLRRHLTNRGMTPEQYRQKWSLPYDYPMVCPAYSSQRSELAKTLGLGSQLRRDKAAAAAKRAKLSSRGGGSAKSDQS